MWDTQLHNEVQQLLKSSGVNVDKPGTPVSDHYDEDVWWIQTKLSVCLHAQLSRLCIRNGLSYLLLQVLIAEA